MATDRSVAELADVKVARAVAEAQALLLPGVTEELSARQFSIRIKERLAGLTGHERFLTIQRMALVVHDMEALVESLRQELADLSQELRKVNQHSGASTAYSRMTQTSSRSLS